jgi:hypothetical protein
MVVVQLHASNSDILISGIISNCLTFLSYSIKSFILDPRSPYFVQKGLDGCRRKGIKIRNV